MNRKVLEDVVIIMIHNMNTNQSQMQYLKEKIDEERKQGEMYEESNN